MRRIFLFLLSACIGFSIQAQSTALSCKVLLQGAYAGNAQMGTALNTNQHLPLLQPFISGIWQYNGSESLISIPPGMVDWVLLELRSTPDTAIARKAAVLYSDGTVKDVNGNSLMTFAVPAGNYYVAVLHRNHLTAMSAQQLSLPASGPVDYTDTSFAGYGHCQIRLAGDVMGLIGGDINQDRVLKYSGAGNDRSIILQRILSEVGGTAINATATGYFVGDLRMDGVVKYTGAQNDPSLIIQNIIALTATTAINAVFSGPVPHAVYAPYSCFPQPDQANAGPDSLNIPDTSIILQANQPVNGTGAWTISSGTGGSLADSSQYNTVFTGQVGNAYTLVWTISNQCGSTRDTVNLSFAGTSAYTCGGILTDPRDGQQYPTVQIGTQCWMAKNLNIGVMVTDHYTGNTHTHCSNNGIIEKYCYNNDPANCAIYGGLYDWNEAMGYTTTTGTQGICPTGWHIPTDAEWCTLTTYLDPTVNCNAWGWSGTDAGGRMKESGTTHWLSPNSGANNSSGFTALGAGDRNRNGNFYYLRHYVYFWSSSEHSSTYGVTRGLYYLYATVNRHGYYKTIGFSVRCLRN